MNTGSRLPGLEHIMIVYASLLGMIIGIYFVSRITIVGSGMGYIPPSQTEMTLPGMFYSGLGTASLVDLPQGVLARVGSTQIMESEFGFTHIDDETMLRNIRLRLPMMLETKLVQRVELQEARAWAAANRIDPKAPLDMLQHAYFQYLYSSVTVDGIELLKVMRHQAAFMGNSNLAERLISAKEYIYDRKKDSLLAEYFHLMGQRCDIELNKKWSLARYGELIDRPDIRQVDAARCSGKPSVVFFTVPRRRANPITEVENQIRQKFGDRVIVMQTILDLDPVTAGRYGITKLFTVVVYDKAGDEFVRYSSYPAPKLMNAVNAVLIAH